MWLSQRSARSGALCEGIPASKQEEINPMLAQCWSTVYNTGPTLNQRWITVAYLLVRHIYPAYTRRWCVVRVMYGQRRRSALIQHSFASRFVKKILQKCTH